MNLWKKTVLEGLERQVVAEIDKPVIIEGQGMRDLRISEPVDANLYAPLPDFEGVDYSDEEVSHVARPNSPAPSGWASGSMSTWGRGARH